MRIALSMSNAPPEQTEVVPRKDGGNEVLAVNFREDMPSLTPAADSSSLESAPGNLDFRPAHPAAAQRP